MEAKDMLAKLSSGKSMPLIGFGTFQIHGKQLIRDVLDHALRAGYRSIDTAAVYGNEGDIGIALKQLLPKYNLKREDIFITSKLGPSDHGDKAVSALETSLRNLDCGYLDLYLIHWPGQQRVHVNHSSNADVRSVTWKHFVDAKNKGLVNDIGVSNYTVKHLQELLANCHGVKPAVNQVEWHPYYHQSDLKKLCKNEGILLQAYSSLGGSNNQELVSDLSVCTIAKSLNKEPAQVLLRWAIQQNIGIIPKARSAQHIQANIDLNFVISDTDLNILNNLTKRRKFAWDPSVVQ